MAEKLTKIIKENRKADKSGKHGTPWILDALEALDKCSSSEGHTPFHIAASMGNTEMFDYLIQVLEVRNSLSPFKDHVGDLYISKDQMIEYESMSNCTPLLLAAKHQRIPMFKSLLYDYGANIYTSDIKLNNCLHYAAMQENEVFIEFINNIDSEKGILQNEFNA